jgi:LPS sulfotransferase NodH
MKPILSYAIVGVQRSGTTLLCESLKNTGIAGVPGEYFLSWENGSWAQEHFVSTRREFIKLIIEKGTTPNGVFGINIMWNTFSEETVPRLRELPEFNRVPRHLLLQKIFPNLRFIWIIRRDKVRQAVSWAKAGQTDIWASHQLEHGKPKQKPAFDFQMIDGLYNLILKGESGWAQYFNDCGIEPFKLYYEDLAESYESKTIEVLKYLGITVPGNLKICEVPVQKQADAINDEWTAKYLEIKKAGPNA